MKAAIRRTYGPPDKIRVEEIDIPTPKSGEMLVRVRATTINRTDVANLRAKPYIMRLFLGLFRPRKVIIGTDFAGEVAQVGEGVQEYKPGDRVFGFNDNVLSSQAEFLTVPAQAEYVTRIPDRLSYKHAAAALEGAHYAYSFVTKTEIRPGQKVLINGATGAIGSALLQFVRQYDVVIAVTCREKDMELVRSLGADRVINYRKEDFTQQANTYDFIFDTVGKSTFGACKPVLEPEGIYISSELGPRSQNLFFSMTTPMRKGKKVIFPIPYPMRKSFPFIIEHLKKRQFRPVIDREYSLDQIREAYKYVQSGQKTGNVLLTFGEK